MRTRINRCPSRPPFRHQWRHVCALQPLRWLMADLSCRSAAARAAEQPAGAGLISCARR